MILFLPALKMLRIRKEKDERKEKPDGRQTKVNPEQRSKALGACTGGQVPTFSTGEAVGHFSWKG